MPDKNWKILPYGKSYGQFVKNAAQQGINLNPTVGDIAAKFWGGSPTDYNFGIGLPVRDQDISTDERLASISLPYTESGYLQTQNLPTENSTIPNYGDTIKDLTQKLTSTPTENPTNPAPTLQIQPQEQPQAQPSVEPPTTNQVVDNATLSATNPDIYALAKLASGDINDKNQWYINQIAAAKNLWDAGKTDADKKAASDYANHIRNLAQMRDISLGQFGDGNNLSADQANLAWGNYVLNEAEKAQNKFQAVQDNLKNNFSESSNDHFWRLYDEYRQQGYGDRKAAILAGRETQTYQQDRVSNLRDAINEYGIDNGNILNQFGVNTLAQIAEEDNIMGTAIANGFETPKGNYEKQQAMILQAMKDAAADNRKQAEILAQKILTEYVQGQITDRTNSTNKVKQDIAQMKENRNDARTELTEKNKFKLEEFKHKNQLELKQADQEFQIWLKNFEISNTAKGKGNITNSAPYKTAKDNLDTAKKHLEMLLKENSNASEDDIKKARKEYEEARAKMQNFFDKYSVEPSEADEENYEFGKNYQADVAKAQQWINSGLIDKDALYAYLTQKAGMTSEWATKIVNGVTEIPYDEEE